ncbi:MAG: GH3 auxin-responsive promoter family protein [Dehalococcoidales bacterium]|nr:GH3 auxin-responsive promoter family protein [Dehalococcoidales bacterium]
MVNILFGCLGFIITHLFDVIALSGIKKVKPVIWLIGNGLIAYALVQLCLSVPKLGLPDWLAWIGWPLVLFGIFFQVAAITTDLPVKKTYVESGAGDQLIKTGFFAMARHPGVIFFIILTVGLTLVSDSLLMLIAVPVFGALDIILVLIQDKYFFPKMFAGYNEYRKETPSIFPTITSIRACIKTINKPKRRIKEVNPVINTNSIFLQGTNTEIWQRYCGFLDLKLADFMNIQKRLLQEQIELLNRCELNKHIMKGVKPRTIEEFRDNIPLTTYNDYNAFFSKRRKGILPEKPITWMHTSGRSGEFTKWIPVSERRYKAMGDYIIAVILLSTSRKRGDFKVKKNDRILYALAPPPFMTGTWARRLEEAMPVSFIPPLDDAERLSFTDRTQEGIRVAMDDGMEIIGGMSSVLLAIGQNLKDKKTKVELLPLVKKPNKLGRLLKGYLKSKLARRSLLPKDLWTLNGIMAGGADTAIYRERIKEMWGKLPLDLYAFTEGGPIAVQTWGYNGMTFFPSLNFYEFIPESEIEKTKDNPFYNPKTVLLNEVLPNHNYELVITNLLGGALVRYRTKDIVRITALRDEKYDIDIPQMEFHSRADNIIDIAGFTRLTEKTIWQAIENSGVDYKDWTASKGGKEQPVLHIYLELNNNSRDICEVTESIHQKLSELDTDYANLEDLLNMKPLRVTVLPNGTFKNYSAIQQASGAVLGRLKPPHLNPSEQVLMSLINNQAEPVILSVSSKEEYKQAVKQ